MEIRADYNEKDDIIVVRGEGDMTTENVKAVVQNVLKVSKESNCHFLLFDIRECNEAQSLIKGFLAMEDLRGTLGLSIEHKTAVVYDSNKYSTERAKFIENVVVTRPNPAFRMFQSMEEATGWLKELKKH